MKKILLSIVWIPCMLLLAWCDFMVPQDNWGNAFSWVWDTIDQIKWSLTWVKINTEMLSWTIKDDSWVRSTVKWYAQEYYDDSLSEYVDKAKQELSWTMNNLKNQYNSWVDSLTNTINDAISGSITQKMNILKM